MTSQNPTPPAVPFTYQFLTAVCPHCKWEKHADDFFTTDDGRPLACVRCGPDGETFKHMKRNRRLERDVEDGESTV